MRQPRDKQHQETVVAFEAGATQQDLALHQGWEKKQAISRGPCSGTPGDTRQIRGRSVNGSECKCENDQYTLCLLFVTLCTLIWTYAPACPRVHTHIYSTHIIHWPSFHQLFLSDKKLSMDKAYIPSYIYDHHNTLHSCNTSLSQSTLKTMCEFLF